MLNILTYIFSYVRFGITTAAATPWSKPNIFSLRILMMLVIFPVLTDIFELLDVGPYYARRRCVYKLVSK